MLIIISANMNYIAYSVLVIYQNWWGLIFLKGPVTLKKVF